MRSMSTLILPPHSTRFCVIMLQQVRMKVANDLRLAFDTILLPSLETHSMTQKPKYEGDRPCAIRSKTAHAMLGRWHYQFRSFLASKVLIGSKELCVITEEFTTQTCAKCGVLNKHLIK